MNCTDARGVAAEAHDDTASPLPEHGNVHEEAALLGEEVDETCGPTHFEEAAECIDLLTRASRLLALSDTNLHECSTVECVHTTTHTLDRIVLLPTASEDPHGASALLERHFAAILAHYQESPHLLQPHLESMMQPLVELLLTHLPTFDLNYIPPAVQVSGPGEYGGRLTGCATPAQVVVVAAKGDAVGEESSLPIESDTHVSGLVLHQHQLGQDTYMFDSDAPKTALHTICRALYLLIRTAGEKACTSYFPNEAAHCEEVLRVLRHWQHDPRRRREWEVRYCCLLWLSNLVLVPFALSVIDSQSQHSSVKERVVPAGGVVAASLPALGESTLAETVLDTAVSFLPDPSRCSEAAALLIARMLTRPDSLSQRNRFFERAQRVVNEAAAAANAAAVRDDDVCASHVSSAVNDTDTLSAFSQAGTDGIDMLVPMLLTIAKAIKLGKREEMARYAVPLLRAVSALYAHSSLADASSLAHTRLRGCSAGDTLLCHTLVKVGQRLALAMLPRRSASWIYHRSVNVLGDCTSSTNAPALPAASPHSSVSQPMGSRDAHSDAVQGAQSVEKGNDEHDRRGVRHDDDTHKRCARMTSQSETKSSRLPATTDTTHSNDNPNDSNTNSVADVDEEESWEHLSEVEYDALERVLQLLLSAMSHRDTVVRWSAAKGLGRVCERLPRSLSQEVVAAVLTAVDEQPYHDSCWHGVMLTLAELCRRGVVCGHDGQEEHQIQQEEEEGVEGCAFHGAAEGQVQKSANNVCRTSASNAQTEGCNSSNTTTTTTSTSTSTSSSSSSLSRVVNHVRRALRFELSRGTYSVGAHVRDAACYTCWSMARAYDAAVMYPHVQTLATALIATAVLDREVNVRRAAAAAFQECVGRLGNFPHGIELVTTVDFFSLSSLTRAYEQVAPAVAAVGADDVDEHDLIEKEDAAAMQDADNHNSRTHKDTAHVTDTCVPGSSTNNGHDAVQGYDASHVASAASKQTKAACADRAHHTRAAGHLGQSAMHCDYAGALVRALMQRQLMHWDRVVREAAARALGILLSQRLGRTPPRRSRACATPGAVSSALCQENPNNNSTNNIVEDMCVEDALSEQTVMTVWVPMLQRRMNDAAVGVRHGALLALAALVQHLPRRLWLEESDMSDDDTHTNEPCRNGIRTNATQAHLDGVSRVDCTHTHVCGGTRAAAHTEDAACVSVRTCKPDRPDGANQHDTLLRKHNDGGQRGRMHAHACHDPPRCRALLEVFLTLDRRRLFRSRGGEWMRWAGCRLLSCYAQRKLPLPDTMLTTHALTQAPRRVNTRAFLYGFLEDSWRNILGWVQQAAAETFAHVAAAYFTTTPTRTVTTKPPSPSPPPPRVCVDTDSSRGTCDEEDDTTEHLMPSPARRMQSMLERALGGEEGTVSGLERRGYVGALGGVPPSWLLLPTTGPCAALHTRHTLHTLLPAPHTCTSPSTPSNASSNVPDLSMCYWVDVLTQRVGEMATAGVRAGGEDVVAAEDDELRCRAVRALGAMARVVPDAHLFALAAPMVCAGNMGITRKKKEEEEAVACGLTESPASVACGIRAGDASGSVRVCATEEERIVRNTAAHVNVPSNDNEQSKKDEKGDEEDMTRTRWGVWIRCLCLAMDDYAVDKRGDVGSHIRLAAAELLPELVLRGVRRLSGPHPPRRAAVLAVVMPVWQVWVRLAMEKLDRVRAAAMCGLARTLMELPLPPRTPLSGHHAPTSGTTYNTHNNTNKNNDSDTNSTVEDEVRVLRACAQSEVRRLRREACERVDAHVTVSQDKMKHNHANLPPPPPTPYTCKDAIGNTTCVGAAHDPCPVVDEASDERALRRWFNAELARCSASGAAVSAWASPSRVMTALAPALLTHCPHSFASSTLAGLIVSAGDLTAHIRAPAAEVLMRAFATHDSTRSDASSSSSGLRGRTETDAVAGTTQSQAEDDGGDDVHETRARRANDIAPDAQGAVGLRLNEMLLSFAQRELSRERVLVPLARVVDGLLAHDLLRPASRHADWVGLVLRPALRGFATNITVVLPLTTVLGGLCRSASVAGRRAAWTLALTMIASRYPKVRAAMANHLYTALLLRRDAAMPTHSATSDESAANADVVAAAAEADANVVQAMRQLSEMRWDGSDAVAVRAARDALYDTLRLTRPVASDGPGEMAARRAGVTKVAATYQHLVHEVGY